MLKEILIQMEESRRKMNTNVNKEMERLANKGFALELLDEVEERIERLELRFARSDIEDSIVALCRLWKIFPNGPDTKGKEIVRRLRNKIEHPKNKKTKLSGSSKFNIRNMLNTPSMRVRDIKKTEVELFATFKGEEGRVPVITCLKQCVLDWKDYIKRL